MIQYVCDRCYAKSSVNNNHIMWSDPGVEAKSYDLCNDCVKHITNELKPIAPPVLTKSEDRKKMEGMLNAAA